MEKLLEIKRIFETIKNAIESKGVSIKKNESPSVYAARILEIKTDNIPPDEDPEGSLPEQPDPNDKPGENPDPDPTPDPDPEPDPEPEINKDTEEIINSDESSTHTITIVYKDHSAVLEPIISYKNEDIGWITISKPEINGDTHIYTVNVAPNYSLDRDAEIIFSCIKDSTVISESIPVTQTGTLVEPPVENTLEIYCDVKELVFTHEAFDTIITVIPKNGNITYLNSIGWITINSAGSNIYRIKGFENQSSTIRSGIITFICSDGTNKVEHVITITQNPNNLEDDLYIKADAAYSSIDSNATILTRTITTNADSWYIKNTLPDWISAEISKNTLVLSIEQNDSIEENRSFEIILEAKRGNQVDTWTYEIQQYSRKPIIADIGSTSSTIRFSSDEDFYYTIVYTKNAIKEDRPYLFWIKDKPEWVTVKFHNVQHTDYIARQISLHTTVNNGEERIGEIVFACKSIDNIESICKIELIQEANEA